ncbi:BIFUNCTIONAL INHIBITOR/LIPID-TRANSFER PROTEIN/SEED STORAGE 2S ALBUMIN SUPERFAMILY PROTEIN [Salix purpurea]|uniref:BIFUNCTIONAL INHIBITOR/LIPID-TRANSFER PROTEIN/SEED STORAGE 2S ALBUMIN SUPERFAMILY PROTEIN n=1 Tax=Salix purpurea TaxID=77065 RepID=A0A9Q0SRX4_SALPP|nr:BIFUNCTIONAL INHIBITOR/LIPID-TRANSFER PROTEIN/SEED STORAGE 2S ALBUMIN SUPERFAMILY PROTEIN [Salix purpurea]
MMGMGKRQLVVLLLVMAALFEGSRAVTVCDISDEGLTACKPSVTKPDPVDPPSADCCKAVSGANFTCLCSYKNSYLLPYLGIDPDLAMALPSKCNLSIPTPTC